MKFHFVTPVWGSSYVETFTTITLPTQLSTGNLGAFSAEDDVIYEIVTRAEDVENIKRSPAFKALDGMVKTRFCLMDDFDWSRHPYILMTDCYNAVLRREWESMTETAFFFLASDLVWADGSFRRTREILEQGKRAVMIDAGIHTNAETFIPAVLREFGNPDTNAISCPPRALMRTAFQHIHDMTMSMVWNNGKIVNTVPAHLYWMPADGMCLCRSWVLHPVAARPRNRTLSTDAKGEKTSPIDHEYIRLACGDYRDVHVVTDSDEILGVEISPANHLRDQIVPGNYTAEQVARWVAGGWVSGFLLRYAKEFIWFHSEEISPEVRKSTEQLSEQAMAATEKNVPFYRAWHALRRLAAKVLPLSVQNYLKQELQRRRRMRAGQQQ